MSSSGSLDRAVTLKKSFNVSGLFFLMFKTWRLNSVTSDAPSCSVIQCQWLKGVEKLRGKFLAQNVFCNFLANSLGIQPWSASVSLFPPSPLPAHGLLLFRLVWGNSDQLSEGAVACRGT